MDPEISDSPDNVYLLHYHFDEACQDVLNEGERVCLEDLQRRLQQKYGHKVRPQTIAKIVRRLEAEHGIGPLKTYYELNTEYFRKVRRHCPKKGRVWRQYLGEDDLPEPPGTQDNAPPHEVDRRQREYNSRYISMIRSLDQFVARLLAKRGTFSADDVCSSIYASSGIRPMSGTIQRRLRRYIDEGRAPTLEEEGEGVYRAAGTSVGHESVRDAIHHPHRTTPG